MTDAPSHTVPEDGMVVSDGASSSRNQLQVSHTITNECPARVPVMSDTRSGDDLQSPASIPCNEGSNPQILKLLVLTGVVGSGKSTFAEALCDYYPGQYKRACQDVLGSRGAVESYIIKQLQQGFNVCVDRTNVDVSQRSNWLQIAQDFQVKHKAVVEVYSLHFDVPYDVCKARLQARTSHETLHTPQAAIKVLNVFSRQLVRPQADEGFHKTITVDMHWCQGNSDGVRKKEVDLVLRKLNDAKYCPGFIAGMPSRGALGQGRRQTNAPSHRGRPGRGAMTPMRGTSHPHGGTSDVSGSSAHSQRQRTLPQAWQRPPPWQASGHRVNGQHHSPTDHSYPRTPPPPS
ncbi:unnamed protein product [Sympodiomycopsis kandeliae]